MDADIPTKLLEKMLQNGSLYFELIKAVFESGKERDEVRLQGVVKHLSETYLQYYNEFVGKYLKIPQLGIHREAFHQILGAMDAYHQFTIDVSDFMEKFSKPLKKSLKTLDQTLRSKHAGETGLKSTKEMYDFISGVLEKEYDDYLKSPGGVQDVADVIQSYVTYREKSDDAQDILLKSLSIPTKKEMEDVYKGIYDLKKRVRNQDKQIAEQQMLINSLSNRIMSLEAGFESKPGNKKPSATVKMKKQSAKHQTAKVKKMAKKKLEK